MTTISRDDLREAYDAQRLPDTIAVAPRAELDSTAAMLAEMHNDGEIDFLASFTPSSLAPVSVHRFFALQQVFCHTLVQIDCPAEAAARACRNIFEWAGNDEAAGFVYANLSEWFVRSPARAEEGLALIRRDPDSYRRLIRPVLLAGANHDAEKYYEAAFAFSDSPVRPDALRALGQIAPIDSEPLIKRAFDRLSAVIDAPAAEDDIPAVVEAASTLLHRSDGRLTLAAEPLLEKASAHRTPGTRFALADGLARHRRHYSEAMIDATFRALGHTTRQDIATPGAIDSTLYQWDLDTDRERVLGLLLDLFSHGEDALDLEQLSDFRHHSLTGHPARVSPWRTASRDTVATIPKR